VYPPGPFGSRIRKEGRGGILTDGRYFNLKCVWFARGEKLF